MAQTSRPGRMRPGTGVVLSENGPCLGGGSGVHEETVRSRTRKGTIPAAKLDNRGAFRLKREDADRFLEVRRQISTDGSAGEPATAPYRMCDDTSRTVSSHTAASARCNGAYRMHSPSLGR